MAEHDAGHVADQHQGGARALEEHVLDLSFQLELVNEDLAALAYSVSHDLRAPLRSIEGFSQILIEEYDAILDSTGQDYLQRVCAAARRMSDMIDDLLQLSRLGRAQFCREQVDLTGMARAIAARLRSTDETRDVMFDIQEEMLVDADPGLLRVVVENLLANAWKFTAGCEQAQIEFRTMMDGGVPAYFVRDNGAGFEMAYAGKLFGPFQRMHPASEFEGRGIGLPLIQRAVRRHGGRVWAEAAPNRGATFYFTLRSAGGTT